MNRGVESHEGCHIYGWLDVKRLAANFHISVHVDDYMLLAQVGHSRCCSIVVQKPCVNQRGAGITSYDVECLGDGQTLIRIAWVWILTGGL